MAPRHAPDAPTRRALEKLLAAAREDPFLSALDEDGRQVVVLYCARAYQMGRERGRYEERRGLQK